MQKYLYIFYKKHNSLCKNVHKNLYLFLIHSYFSHTQNINLNFQAFWFTEQFYVLYHYLNFSLLKRELWLGL